MKQKLVVSVVAIGLLMSSLLANIAQAQPAADVIYDSIPDPLPPSFASLSYQSQWLDEVGDHIAFAGTQRELTSVTVTMNTWARQAEYSAIIDPIGWEHPITLNLCEVDYSGDYPEPGAVIATVTQTFLIPWRPAADPDCTGTKWQATDDSCHDGYAFNVTFDLPGVEVPDEIIFGVAYNTRGHGANPVGAVGPYDKLNVGLTTTATTVGTNVNLDAIYWDTSQPNNAGYYPDGVAGGLDIFRYAHGWSPYTLAVQFNATQTSTPSEMIDDLQESTAELVDHRKTERTLLASLNRAERYMEIRPQFARVSLLKYILQVQLFEAFGLIDDDAADQLVAQAQALIESLD